MLDESNRPRVLIVGAGLGGLTLAQSLRKKGIPFEIFERDTDVASRSQGWAIGMHSIFDGLSTFSSDMPSLRECAHHLKPLNLNSQICLYYRGMRVGVQDTPDTPCLRANRLELRKWLATNVNIHWGKKLHSVEDREDKSVLHFEDGTSASGDVIVGADGVQSNVREHLLGRPNADILNVVPSAIIIGETTLSGPAMERQLSLGHSCYVAGPADARFSLFVGLSKINEDLSGDYYWFLVWQDDAVEAPDYWLKSASKTAKHTHALKLAQSLDPKFHEIIQLTPEEGIRDGQMQYRDAEIADLPAPQRLILLGDAAHPMTPFRGEGGMHAIRDAMNLADALGQVDMTKEGSLQANLQNYQQEMSRRGLDAVRNSRNAISNNVRTSNKIIAWGYEAKQLPTEDILLEDCRQPV
ncbi:FAD/NAD(P)-binding domain-containing protein [Xylariaceae sp. FL0016]|nr:FAD/NAD(P)-binding domain-containing protein [Xylariaceae sp. FL0016]